MVVYRRFVLLVFAVSGCAERGRSERAAGGRTVAVLTPAVARDPSAPTTLPWSLPFGTIGRFVDVAQQLGRERMLAEAIAVQRFRVRERFAAHLGAALEARGDRALIVPAARFDADLLPRPPPWRGDLLLDVVVEEFGYAAPTPDGPFVPYAVALVRGLRNDGTVAVAGRVAVNVPRPPSLSWVPGPQEPTLGADFGAHVDPEATVGGIDAALRTLAFAVAARIP
ncbi:hypothetical protein [Elioraea thermophila]|uniref:hypothetical protein n=1 Tax=Elioraea thermophila TaxID=2185104 RepID=UPI0013006134|nr:hypothetical protein [Elioraea thermophila]